MRTFIFSLLVALALPLFAQDAEWITTSEFSDSSLANSWLVFEREFYYNGADAGAKIGADSKYWLWINGLLVIREGGLKWGPAPGDYYYDEIDLRPYLRMGSNKVQVAVWYFGKQGFAHQSSGRAGFYLSAPRTGLVTNAEWSAALHPAFLRDGPGPKPNYRLAESNIVFDANLADNRRVDDPLFGFTGDWRAAHPFSRPVSGQPRPIPQWKDFGLKDYPNTPSWPFVSNGDTVVVDLPHNAQITAYLQIFAPASAPTEARTIDIRTDNYRGGGPPNVRTTYVARPGLQTFETPAWFNGHRVRYHIPAGIEVLRLSYRETGFATEFSGSFTCDDPFYNRLWEKARRTLYITMRDSYMDCPDRERAQWWGDVVLESGETFFALDRRSDRLTAKAIRELLAWQRPDSTIYSPVPAGNWHQELPTQMLASVGRYGVWNYYLHTGDRGLIEEVYPAMKRYLDLWKLDENGLVIPRKGGWTWGDWGDHKDMPLIFNGWYYLALDGLAQSAELVGDAETARASRGKMDRLARTFNDTFWTGQGYRSPNHKGPTDDRGQALAVIAGIAPSEFYPALRQVFQGQQHASPYFEKYVEEALFNMGYPNDALSRMKDRFGPMTNSKLTTLWEGWDIGSAKWGGGTYNHAWSGGPLTLLSQYVAGVSPTAPGWKTVRIAPQLGPLNKARAVIDTPLGLLTVSVTRLGNGEIDIKYDAPRGMVVNTE